MNCSKKICLKILIPLLILGIIGFFIRAKRNTKTDNKTYNKLIDSSYNIYSFPIPDTLYFAQERVPLEHFDVRESLDKEILKIAYWHSQTFLYIKRANRYFPEIERILAQNKIPEDFKYLAVAESGLNANAVSPSKAAGYWQFLEKVGRYYNLEINKEIDQRRHLQKSTVAACRLLKSLYRKYKNWTLAAAAYNMGQGNLDRVIKHQKIHNYYDLLLNNETARYVYRIIAFKLILSEPQNFGFTFRQEDLYPPIPQKAITVDSTIDNWADFALEHNTNYKILKILNPWLIGKNLENKQRRTYKVRLPKHKARNTGY